MKTTITDWNYFDFHDSFFLNAEEENDNTIWYLESVNLSSEHPFNPYSCYMQTDILKITFEKFHVCNVVFSTGELIYSGEAQAGSYLMQFIKKNCEIIKVTELSCENGVYLFCFYLVDNLQYMEATISFQNAILEWNSYKDKAWYVYAEEERRIKSFLSSHPESGWIYLPPDIRTQFDAELSNKLTPSHPLSQIKAAALAKSKTADDIIVTLSNGNYAIVHLTYRKSNQTSSPKFQEFSKFDELFDFLINDKI